MRTRARLLALLLLASGCTSDWINLSPRPPAEYERLGPASAEACGDQLLFLPWHQVFSRGLNTRVERAYDEAVARVEGATRLVDVTLRERWYWWGLGSSRCVEIRGEAIR